MIGHKKILSFFKKSFGGEYFAHAYLFSGPRHIGKRTVALEVAKMFGIKGKSSPDLLVVNPVGEKARYSVINLKQIKSVQRHLGLSPYSAQCKIGIISQADRMKPEAANCLLKTLEEPPQRSIIILTANSGGGVLPTISSRCQIVRFSPVSRKEMESHFDSRIVDLSNGRPGLAFRYAKDTSIVEAEEKIYTDFVSLIKADLNERFQFVENLSKDRGEAVRMMKKWQMCLRRMIVEKMNGVPSAYSISRLGRMIRSVQEAQSVLTDSNVSGIIALEVLMLKI